MTSNKLLRSNLARPDDFGALITKRPAGREPRLWPSTLFRLECDDQRLRPLEERQEALRRLVCGARLLRCRYSLGRTVTVRPLSPVPLALLLGALACRRCVLVS